MAFTTPLQVAGRSYPSAYVKATVARSDSIHTVIQLQCWETEILRREGVPELSWPNSLRVLATSSIQAINPVDYGYQLLEASGEFTDATWNV